MRYARLVSPMGNNIIFANSSETTKGIYSVDNATNKANEKLMTSTYDISSWSYLK